jgi:hypothetical protein
MSLFAFVLLAAGCESGLTSRTAPVEEEEEPDVTAPTIVDELVAETVTFGTDVTVTATVTDEETGVLAVYLYYKNVTEGSSDWRSAVMVAAGEPDVYSGLIPGASQRSSGMHYYIEAVDRAQPTNVAWAPEDGPEDPYQFQLSP